MNNDPTEQELYSQKLWRMSHNYKIRDKDGDIVVYKPKAAQAHFIVNKTLRNFILKSRQLGISTECCIDKLDDTIHIPGFTAGIFAHTIPDATKLFDSKILTPLKHMSPDILGGIEFTQDQEKSIKIKHKNGADSRIFVAASARSDTLSSAHISELERMEEQSFVKAKEMFEGTIGAVPINGEITIESTPRLSDGIFKTHFMNAWNAERSSSYNPKRDGKAFFYNWRWDLDGIAIAPEYSRVVFPKEMLAYEKLYNLTPQELNYYFFHWTRMGEDWASMRKEFPTTIQEAFQANRVGAAFSEMLDMMYTENRIRHVPYEPHYPVYVVFELGVNDATSMVWVQIVSNEYRIIDHYRDSHKPMTHYIREIQGKKYADQRVYLPHDAVNKSIANYESATDYFDHAGMKYILMPKSFERDRVECLRTKAHSMVISVDLCPVLIESLGKCHYRNTDDKKMVHGVEQNDFDSLSQAMMFIDDIGSEPLTSEAH